MRDTPIPAFRSVVMCDRVLANGFWARGPAVAGWFLVALLLLGFCVGGPCVGGLAATAAAAELDGLGAIAKSIEATVTRLGYPRARPMIWCGSCAAGTSKRGSGNLPGPRYFVAAKRGEHRKHRRGSGQRDLHEDSKQRSAIAANARYFHLSAVVEDRKAQCLGYAQLFYILGNSVGLRVKTINVLVPAAGPLPAGVGHVACAVDRSDETCLVVDLGLQTLSRPFVFQNEYIAAGNYWELKRGANPPGIHRRVRSGTRRG